MKTKIDLKLYNIKKRNKNTISALVDVNIVINNSELNDLHGLMSALNNYMRKRSPFKRSDKLVRDIYNQLNNKLISKNEKLERNELTKTI